jgi:hypothetical protein
LNGNCYDLKLPKQDEQKACTGDSKGQLDKLGLGSLNFLSDSGVTAGIAVVQVDGKWYVSPIRTITDPIISVLKALDQDKLNKIIDDFRNLASPKFKDIGPMSSSPTTRP